MALKTPLIGRRRELFRPPWPWPRLSGGLEGAVFEAGLSFLGPLAAPPDELCNFFVGSEWSLDGSLSGSFPYDAADVTAGRSYAISHSLSGVGYAADLGEYRRHDVGAATSSLLAGASYTGLTDLAELPSFNLVGDAHLQNGMVWVSAFEDVDTVNYLGDPITFQITYSASVFMPEAIVVGGVPQWRIQMLGEIVVQGDISDPDNEVIITASEGLDFVDPDYPANDGEITAHGSGCFLELTINRTTV